jgi:hypothetical protein
VARRSEAVTSVNPSSSNATSGVNLRMAARQLAPSRQHFKIGLCSQQRYKTLQHNGMSICYHQSNAAHGHPSLGLATHETAHGSGDLTPLDR